MTSPHKGFRLRNCVLRYGRRWIFCPGFLRGVPRSCDLSRQAAIRTVAPYPLGKVSRKSPKTFQTGCTWASSLASLLLLSTAPRAASSNPAFGPTELVGQAYLRALGICLVRSVVQSWREYAVIFPLPFPD